MNAERKWIAGAITCRWEHIVHKDKYCFLSAQFDSFTNHIHKLPHRQISRNKVSALPYSSELSG